MNEAARHRLYNELGDVLSPESASELMSLLPPVGWSHVATKDDIVLLRSEIDLVRSELRGEMGDLRTELRGEMGDLRGEVGDLRTELRGEIADLRIDMTNAMRQQTIALVGVMVSLYGIAWATITFG